jgi:hypothetical protein
VTRAILDDHLLRDLLADDTPAALAELLSSLEPATTNLYLYRLAKSVASSSGGAVTGGWSAEHRQALGARLLSLPADVEIVPMREVAYRMAEIASAHRVSTLGAECVAAAEHLGAPLCVWSGDDGPSIRSASAAVGIEYVTIDRQP